MYFCPSFSSHKVLQIIFTDLGDVVLMQQPTPKNRKPQFLWKSTRWKQIEVKGKQYFGWSSFCRPIRPQCLYDLPLPLPAFMCLGLLCGTQWPLIKDWAQALRQPWRHSYQMPTSQNSARPPEINGCIVSHGHTQTMNIFRLWFKFIVKSLQAIIIHYDTNEATFSL